jgi:predicted S18 family serine protease
MAAMLMLFQLSSASCDGSISQYVPAVVGNGGGLVNVTVSLAPGSGDVFATIYPRTALSTQESISDAVSYAYALSGRQECDVLVDFATPASTDYVEGPSAGAALSVMTYALIENRTMRKDAIMTGTIDATGGVGPVGGLYEKAKGAAQEGAKYFITPVEGFYEALLLQNVEKEYGITVLQAHNASEIIGFMLDNRSIAQVASGVEKRPIPDYPHYDSSAIEGFGSVAQRTMGLEQQAEETLNGTDNETLQVKDFYGNEVQRQMRLLDEGYLFGAANEAFLNYIDISTIRAITAGDADLPAKKGEAGICLSQIKRPAMTDANFEWVVGSDLRQEWAYQKLNATQTDGQMVSDEKYAAYNELMYAQAWCEVSKGLAAAAPAGGAQVDEAAWKALADKKLAVARALPRSSDDTQTKMDAAVDSYGKGRYGAAIYDAVYAITMDGAAQKPAGAGAQNGTAELLNESRTSLWGRVYQSQGALLQQEGDYADAHNILSYAKALDNATDEMKAALPQPAAQPENGTPTRDVAAVVLVVCAILMFLLLLVLILGRGNTSQRTRTADGAKQKKGRA